VKANGAYIVAIEIKSGLNPLAFPPQLQISASFISFINSAVTRGIMEDIKDRPRLLMSTQSLPNCCHFTVTVIPP